MALLDIIIVGNNINAFSIAVDAASRGFNVTLLDAKNAGEPSPIQFPLTGSGAFDSMQFSVKKLLANLPEVKLFHKRAPSLCHWLPIQHLRQPPVTSLEDQLSQKLYAHHLKKMGAAKQPCFSSTEKIAQAECFVNSMRLLPSIKQLAQDQGATIIGNSQVESIKKKGEIWSLTYKSEHQTSSTLTARAMINATGAHVTKLSTQWFEQESRCEVLNTHHLFLAYTTDRPWHAISYCHASALGPFILYPATPTNMLIAFNQSLSDFPETGRLIDTLASLNLPIPSQSNPLVKSIIPGFELNPYDLHNRDYLIELLCHEGVRPLVNVIGTDTIQARLLAQQAVNSLTDYLPPRPKSATQALKLI